MSGLRRVLIVGGSIAGWTTASALREGGYEGTIVVVEREPACYDRPPLSKTALIDGAPMADLAFADAATVAGLDLDLRTGHCATRVTAGSVELDDGTTLTGDAVVLATGAIPRDPAFPGATLPGVTTLRTYADARALERLVGRRVAVVGAGLIGAEAAAALRQAGSAVTLIDPSEIPGTRVFGATLAAHLHAFHAAAGVDVRADTVTRIAAVDGGLRVSLGKTDPVDVDGVLVGTGVRVDTTLADGAGVATDSGIIVDEAGRTSVPGIYAAGDATRRRAAAGLLPCQGHWDAARLDGRAVAAAILGGTPEPRGADWFWSDRYGHHVEVVGEMAGAGREVVRLGAHPTVFVVDGDRLVGAASVDDPMAVRAARRLIDRSVGIVADQLADPAVPLRSLVPRG